MIRLRVSGDRDRAVQLVRNLERSKRFLAAAVDGRGDAGEGGGIAGQQLRMRTALAPAGVEFEILANYNPLPPGRIVCEPEDGEGSGGSRRARLSDGGERQRGLRRPAPAVRRKAGAR